MQVLDGRFNTVYFVRGTAYRIKFYFSL